MPEIDENKTHRLIIAEAVVCLRDVVQNGMNDYLNGPSQENIDNFKLSETQIQDFKNNGLVNIRNGINRCLELTKNLAGREFIKGVKNADPEISALDDSKMSEIYESMIQYKPEEKE